MKQPIRVVHYLNQFFGQIGGEEAADQPLIVKDGFVGTGMLFKQILGDDFEIVATLICGDNYFSTHQDEVLDQITEVLKKYQPDLFLAGPAFNAGRYGPSCCAICQRVDEIYQIPCITGMYEENPGKELFHRTTYIVKTKDSAAGMRPAAESMAALAKKIISNKPISPEVDNYFPRGFKKNIFVEKTGASRALDMLVKKMESQPYKTELASNEFETVMPARPIEQLNDATIAMVTDGGLTDKGNTKRLESARATKFLSLDISGYASLNNDSFGINHGGYDNTLASENPNIIVPLDILRELETEGAFKKLHETIYSTAGNGTSIENSRSFGESIARQLKEAGVDGAILTST